MKVAPSLLHLYPKAYHASFPFAFEARWVGPPLLPPKKKCLLFLWSGSTKSLILTRVVHLTLYFHQPVTPTSRSVCLAVDNLHGRTPAYHYYHIIHWGITSLSLKTYTHCLSDTKYQAPLLFQNQLHQHLHHTTINSELKCLQIIHASYCQVLELQLSRYLSKYFNVWYSEISILVNSIFWSATKQL